MRRRWLFAIAFFAIAAVAARAQTARDDRFFTSDGIRIHYVDAGRGEPVVLVHGFSSSLEANWAATGVIDALAGSFRVVALDCRGHGRSDKPHDPSSYGLHMVDDIANLLDHLGIRRAHIVGYSMGGAITGKFVTMRQDRVATATFGGSTPRLGWTARNQQDAEELAASLEQGRGMRPLILRLAPPGESKPSDEEVDRQSRAILGRNDPLALAAVQRGNKTQAVTLDEIRAVQLPMLAVVGSADPIKVGVEAFNRIVPAVRVVVIDGATHAGTRNAPGRPEFHEAVREFLAAHRIATSQ
jgi:pimeloyl-ACP methyl ester carboxylesterase